MPAAAIQHLRIAGIIEGISYLILLFIAMPLKYMYQKPEYVRVVGMAHGVLFVVFCIALFIAWRKAQWAVSRCALVFVASLIPFGTFLLDRKMRDYIQEAQRPS